nr:immunoglobulin light chain junction region [Mus musculus]
CQQTKEVPLTF